MGTSCEYAGADCNTVKRQISTVVERAERGTKTVEHKSLDKTAAESMKSVRLIGAE